MIEYYTCIPVIYEGTPDRLVINPVKILFKCDNRYISIEDAGLCTLANNSLSISDRRMVNISVKKSKKAKCKNFLKTLGIQNNNKNISMDDIYLNDSGDFVSRIPSFIYYDPTTNALKKAYNISYGFICLEKHEFDSDDDAKLWFEMEYNL